MRWLSVAWMWPLVFVCLLALFLHVFWIKQVSLSVWRWVDMAGLLAFYGFVRLSSPKEIRLLVACVMAGGVLQCLYAGMQGTGLFPSLHNAFPMTGSFLNPAPLAGYLAVSGACWCSASSPIRFPSFR